MLLRALGMINGIRPYIIGNLRKLAACSVES